MKRYQDEHCFVTLSDEGLRRAMKDNALHIAAMRRSESLLIGVCWGAAIAFGMVIGWASVYGN